MHQRSVFAASTTLPVMQAQVWVVMPTYNEAENIDAILRGTTAELERLVPGQYRVLVVDDASPDGTGKLAEALGAELETVEVLHRSAKTGLGHAYLAGFSEALAGGAELVIEMDADFSHDPAYLGDLLDAADDADLVLGSRYVAGGGARTGVCLRRLVSRGGGVYARADPAASTSTISPAASSASGARCSRRSTCRASAPRATCSRSRSPTARSLAGFRVEEVPIVFSRPHHRDEQDVGTDRDRGDGAVPRLRRKRRARCSRRGARRSICHRRRRAIACRKRSAPHS